MGLGEMGTAGVTAAGGRTPEGGGGRPCPDATSGRTLTEMATIQRLRFPGTALLIALAACAQSRRPASDIEGSVLAASWYAGDSTCAGSPPVRVRAYDADLFILRQAACTNYEKPFLYLIFGSERVLLLDSGAGNVDIASPVDTLVRMWLQRHRKASIELVVAHSHAHGDHVAGDSQFAHRPHTRVIARDTASVRAFVGVRQWPIDSGTIDLGKRVLDVLPIPGHQPASIALYDRKTGVLFTGDTFYPGRLYVRDTAAFATSIARLATFARTHPVSHILGAHIEQTKTPFVDYPVGTINQPDEHHLDLGRSVLFEVDSVVRAMRGRFVRTRLRDVTIWPQ